MQLQARIIDDGKGPYRWRPVIDTVGGIALGGMYDVPQEITDEQGAIAKMSLEAAKYEWREA